MDCARRTVAHRDGRLSRFRVGSDKGSCATASSAQYGAVSSTAGRPVCHIRAREGCELPEILGWHCCGFANRQCAETRQERWRHFGVSSLCGSFGSGSASAGPSADPCGSTASHQSDMCPDSSNPCRFRKHDGCCDRGSFEAYERASGGDHHADAARIGNSPSGICGSAIRRETRSDERWRCNGCEQAAVAIRCADLTGTALRRQVRTHVRHQFY